MNGNSRWVRIGGALLVLALLASCGNSADAPPGGMAETAESGWEQTAGSAGGGSDGASLAGGNAGGTVTDDSDIGGKDGERSSDGGSAGANAAGEGPGTGGPDGASPAGGGSGGSGNGSGAGNAGTGILLPLEGVNLPEKADYSSKDLATEWSGEIRKEIDLGKEKGPVRIKSAGTYVLSGTLSDGGVVVEASKSDDVHLVLNGAHIRNPSGPAIEIKEADKVVVTLQEGTENSATDGANYADTSEDAANAAVYSKADLTVNGSGKWIIRGNYRDGLTGRDDLKIVSGQIEVTAVDDGVIGRDLLAMRGGSLTVEAGGDGLKSTNDKEEGRGNIMIEGGSIRIAAGGDGMQSAMSLRVDGGDIAIVAGGGSGNGRVHVDRGFGWKVENTKKQAKDTPSMKGIKAAGVLMITGGDVNIDSADDALHSNGSVIISGGNLELATGDDGIHADANVAIEGGTIRITQSYEGVEGSGIAIVGGDLHIRAADDGINVAGGNDGDDRGGPFGRDSFKGSAKRQLVIGEGTIRIDADGDGIDANGSIFMSGGDVLVSGPTSPGNGALDYDGAFEISGGLLVAAGSAGMARAPSASSSQPAVAVIFSSEQATGTQVRLLDTDGREVASVKPDKRFQTVVFSSPDLKTGATYTVTGDSINVTVELGETVTWVNEQGVTSAPRGFGGGFGRRR